MDIVNDYRIKRKAAHDLLDSEDRRSTKRHKSTGNGYEAQADSRSPSALSDEANLYPLPLTLIKEGTLRKYNETTTKYEEASVKLYSNGDLEWTILDNAHLNLLPFSAVHEPSRVRIKPSSKVIDVYSRKGSGFLITTTLQLKDMNYLDRILFAAYSPEECEWMRTINNTVLKRDVAFKNHNHPMTRCISSTDPGAPSIGPSIIRSNGTIRCLQCGIDSLHFKDFLHCEFCGINLCKECSEFQPLKVLTYSVNHPQHPLVELFGTTDVTWLPRSYRTASYTCSTCKQKKCQTLYHCVECGEYDECFDCFKPVTKDTEQLDQIGDDEPLAIGLLSQVITKSRCIYELDKMSSRKPPQAASMITTKCWDVSQIYNIPVPAAYFEVTIHQLEGQYVSVGIGNHKFVQNQLLGYQQNSFGYCNNGQVTMNVGEDVQQFPSYGAGDTIGVGMLLDSYNTRRLYFTKNGQFLQCLGEHAQVDMDCYPGVSVTSNTCQQLNFWVNSTGPFVFDLNVVPNYRLTRRNWLEQLPTELIVKILSCAISSPTHVIKYFYISKWFSTVASDNDIWKPMFLQRWPMQNANLKIKSWLTLYKRRHKVEAFVPPNQRWKRLTLPNRFPNGVIFIENCDREFDCSLIIENLSSVGLGSDSRLECEKCHKYVHKVQNEAEVEQLNIMGPYIMPKPKQSLND